MTIDPHQLRKILSEVENDLSTLVRSEYLSVFLLDGILDISRVLNSQIWVHFPTDVEISFSEELRAALKNYQDDSDNEAYVIRLLYRELGSEIVKRCKEIIGKFESSANRVDPADDEPK